MPTTLTGLVLFVVLLLPGFAYLVGKERAGTERRTSPFRETVAVVAASVASELAVVILSWYWWSRHLDIDKLITTPNIYWQERPGLLASWALGLLLAATLLAYLATHPWIRRWIPGKYPHPSTTSAWWVLFETWRSDRYVFAGCTLDDGSYVAGTVESFNMSADDDTARDMVLGEPIEYRRPNAHNAVPLNCGAVCVPANRIVMIETSYLSRRRTSLELAAVRAAAREAAAGREADPASEEPTSPASGPAPRSAADPSDLLSRSGVGHTLSPNPASPSMPVGSSRSPASAHGYDQPRQPPSRVGHALGPSHRLPGRTLAPDQVSTGRVTGRGV